MSEAERAVRVLVILQGLSGLALAFLVIGAARWLRAWRRDNPRGLGRAETHVLPLVVLTASGALLRVAGGNRVPGFEGRDGHAHGFSDVAALLGERAPHLDPHGSGPAALADLLFALAPREEVSWIALQATLAVLTIPLVYLGALSWLRSTREATWAAAVYALLPCAAYFAMTEVRTVAGAFFVMLAVALTGAAVSAQRASWLASAGLFAVFATTFHPVLAAAPLVVGLALLARDESAAFLKTPLALLALAGTGAAWAIMLRLIVVQLDASGEGVLLGESAAAALGQWFRLLLPTVGAGSEQPFNAFTNTYATPPLIIVAWFAGLVAMRSPTRRRAIVALVLAALVMTLPGMVGGRLDPARLQYAATPLHAMLAGVGIVSLLELLAGRLSAPRLQRGVPAGMAIALGLSAAISPGPLSETFVLESERRVVLRALPALTDACDVWVAPAADGAYTGSPSYLTWQVLDPARWKTLAPNDDLASGVAVSLGRDGCAYYYRPSMCWVQPPGDPPASPHPTALRAECAATEARLVLEPLHAETIRAVSASTATYRRPQIDVGFFRIRALAL